MVQYKDLGVIACEPPRRAGQVARTIAEKAGYGDIKLSGFQDETGTVGCYVYVGEQPIDEYHVITIIPSNSEPDEGKHPEPDERRRKYRKFAVEVTPLGEKKVTEDIIKEVQDELTGK